MKTMKLAIARMTCVTILGTKLWNNIPGNKSIKWVQGSEHGYVPPEYEGRDFTISKIPSF